MVLHPYQRTITRNGKKIKAWYYWFTDEQGKQVRRSCGQKGKPCLTKREALEFIESINRDDLKKDRNMTIYEYTHNMFDVDSDYTMWQKYKGNEIVEKTRQSKIRTLKKILEVFGETKIKDFKSLNIEKWLIKSPLSVSQKNLIIGVINEIFRSLYHDEIINNLIKVQCFSIPKKSKKGILTIDEIHKFFPDNYDELIKIWQNGRMTEFETYQFATMMYLILTTGMRSGELRALKWEQFIYPNVILLNSMIDSNDERVDHLKKGNDLDKKWRILILPTKTVNMLDTYKVLLPYTPEYVFEFKNEFVKRQYLLKHFHRALELQGIDWRQRKLTIHSLRFTYNTIMKNKIDNNQLRKLMGHEKEEMTEYYDRSTALDNLPLLLQNKGIIDSVFN